MLQRVQASARILCRKCDFFSGFSLNSSARAAVAIVILNSIPASWVMVEELFPMVLVNCWLLVTVIGSAAGVAAIPLSTLFAVTQKKPCY